MSNNHLCILISTIDSRILNLEAILQPYDKKICYVVSHQITKELEQNILNFIDNFSKRKDVQYSVLEGKGVAKNRNNTLSFIKPSSICLILDDDIILCENTFDTVIESFDKNASADFISFKILDLEGDDYKSYPKEKQWHTLQTLAGIGTTEIAFRSHVILKNDVKFDERFGPGAENYPLGEDFIFAMDMYHLKTKMLFLPIPIVMHPRGSTGGSLDSRIIFARGAVFARVFGFLSFIIDIYFSFKKRKSYQHEYSFYQYLKLMLLGSHDFLYKRESSQKINDQNQDKEAY